MSRFCASPRRPRGSDHRVCFPTLKASALLLALAFPACSAPKPSQDLSSHPEDASILEVTDAFFEALSEGDTVSLGALIAPGAALHSVRTGPSGPVLGARTRQDFLDGIGSDDNDFLERVWDPVVMVEGDVAMVWTPYDFHLNGEFSHCGVDVLTLLNDGTGWRITGVTYNVVRGGCEPSPLGPPG